jgi:hypothetical protein
VFITSYNQAVVNSPEKRTLPSRKESEQIGRSSEDRRRRKKDTYLRHTCRKSVTAHVISRKKTATAPILQKAAQQPVLIWPF